MKKFVLEFSTEDDSFDIDQYINNIIIRKGLLVKELKPLEDHPDITEEFDIPKEVWKIEVKDGIGRPYNHESIGDTTGKWATLQTLNGAFKYPSDLPDEQYNVRGVKLCYQFLNTDGIWINTISRHTARLTNAGVEIRKAWTMK